MKKTMIKDIYEGEIISAWQDEGWTYLSFPFATVSFPNENWDEFKKDLRKMVKEK
jgi:hypothetical protein